MTPIHDSTGANWPFSDKFNIPPCHNDTSTSSIDIKHIAISHSHDRIIQNQNQSLSVPLAPQPVNGTQQSLLRSPAQQSLIEAHRSVDLSTSIDITDDTSLTLVSIPDADINDIDNNSGNIATRVRAKNEKARKNTVHEKSQHFNTLNIYNLTHTLNQDINNVGNSSETSESQSIDINSIKINNHVPNDCESLPIDIDEISTRGRERVKGKWWEKETETGNRGTTKVVERRGEKRTEKMTRKGKQNGKGNEELAKAVARREEKWKEKVKRKRKDKREGTA